MAKVAIEDLEQLRTLAHAQLSEVLGGGVRLQQGRIWLDGDPNVADAGLYLNLHSYTFGLEKTLR